MPINSYRDLFVWQRAMELVKELYILGKKMPQDELYSLTNQMKRAAISIPANIAEGHGRSGKKEYLHFLSIANGSRTELETELQICVRIGYLKEKDIEYAMSLSMEIAKMLKSLMKKLAHSPKTLSPKSPLSKSLPPNT
jgi:four helix bundle protein